MGVFAEGALGPDFVQLPKRHVLPHQREEHPEQMGHLRDNPELVLSAIEEGLRYDGTAQLTQRVAREDLVVRGKTIRKGEMLQLALGAANRDPEVFVEPDRFDISRAHDALA